MQDKPTSTDLLEAIQDFLMKEVLPQFKDKELLSYKTLVSWNMLGVVSREIRSGEELLDKELGRLVELLNKNLVIPPTLDEKKNLAHVWNVELRDKIRREKLSSENSRYWNHVKETVKEKVEVINPRFITER
ncbi:DUF6285 domain-containing protein [Leptospira borgpetersenii]|uniref:DUF6285 domain-containing protein n=3 Tax=Leptospira borgpetersenii TaxID=174 RepID=Q04QA7_LEPBJ|nr:DUF6285 domain-containing protein [Leptospira borgpetersenii]EMO62168.1 hypothetical protein LEP1GSC133_4899 [Leptospira borgpetersenii serovar Pomona str. 200901868]ABJ76913.1 Conserved hypothetical protein [Leptospira borgpetersenii serovar Hardjo-bovis str. JB197]ABJ78220.1 Conserved hypothetical protein [Leptospira borgpetersenii serovar Hardjo-bovis str. L550]AMX57431.1 hypothetical protein LBK6_03295 [Leptospira borgpetersenii serovar Hardjo]AMX60662.1 hypothetical protein LBK9_03240 